MRSLFLPLPLLLAPLAAPLLFISPAEAQTIGPCCVSESKEHPPDRHPEENAAPPSPVAARVRSPNELALEAAAEAPIPVDAPVVNAIGIPLYPIEEERRGVSEPVRVPIVAGAGVPPVDPDGERMPDRSMSFPGCCQLVSEIHPGKPPHLENPLEPENPLVPVSAKVKSPDERALAAAVELPIPTETPLVNAIGVELDAERGVSEPTHVPAVAGAPDNPIDLSGCCTTVGDRERQAPLSVDAPWSLLLAMQAKAEIIIPVLVLLLAIGFLLRRRWRKMRPLTRPLPGELPWPDLAPMPQPEPELALARAKARKVKRELEPA